MHITSCSTVVNDILTCDSRFRSGTMTFEHAHAILTKRENERLRPWVCILSLVTLSYLIFWAIWVVVTFDTTDYEHTSKGATSSLGIDCRFYIRFSSFVSEPSAKLCLHCLPCTVSHEHTAYSQSLYMSELICMQSLCYSFLVTQTVSIHDTNMTWIS